MKKKLIIYGFFTLLAAIILIYLLAFAVRLTKNVRILSGSPKANFTDDFDDGYRDMPDDENNLSVSEKTADSSIEEGSVNPRSNKDDNNYGENDTDSSDEADEKRPDESPAPEDKEDPQHEHSDGMAMDVRDIEKSKNETDEITFGIDVSKWQGIIDWKKVKDAGVEFAMIRVGYRTQVDGKITEDPYAKYNLQQAQKNGIKLGAYFFSTAVNEKEAKEEAKWVAEFIAP